MSVLLVQPPEPYMPLEHFDSRLGYTKVQSPPWNLLCLRSYIISRTRHTCALIDCRLYSDLEKELVRDISAMDSPRFVVVRTTTKGLGEAAAVLDIAKRHFPNARTVIYGQHPSQYPDRVDEFARADFALAGDPEPILRNLLDYADVPQRLRRIPGLLYRGKEEREPCWMPDLKTLTAPDWEGFYWGAYVAHPEPPAQQLLCAEIRLTRGHTRTNFDRAYGDRHEPFREWPLDRLAPLVAKSAAKGATEVYIGDPPGIWTVERIQAWCRALNRVRNTQPWRLQMFPVHMTEHVAQCMADAGCKYVDIIVPSCDYEVMDRYDCTVGTPEMVASNELLASYGINVKMHFWVGSPEERNGEADRITQTIRRLGYCPYALHPFPYRVDQPMRKKLKEKADAPSIDDWIHWSLEPWTAERPIPLWGGVESIDHIEEQILRVQRSVQRSPARALRRLYHRIRSTNWIHAVENRAIAALTRQTR